MNQNTIRILLIEDNPGDAKVIAQILSDAGNGRFALEHAKNLQGGLDILKGNHIDVLLLDLGLPGSSGFETVSKMRAAAPNVPVIVLTGTDVPQTILESIKVGAKDYFVKSRIEPKKLIVAIMRQTGRSSDFDEPFV
jgi:two-component system cell cycle response regulator